MDKKNRESLQKTALFCGLPDETLEGLLSRGRVRRYARGEVLLRAGDETDAIGIVLEGTVHLERDDPMGNRELVGTVTEGEIFGEVFALLPGAPATVTAAADTAAAALFLPAAPLLQTPETAMRLTRLIVEKNLALTEKLRHMSRRTTREKLLSYLAAERERAKSERFTIALNRQQLADYLAVDRCAMCRELSRLRTEGLIDFDRRQLFFPHGR